MRRYEVSAGTSRGETRRFWFRKNADLFLFTNENAPFLTFRDRYKKESKNVNWVDMHLRCRYINGKKIKTTKLEMYYDGLNCTYLLSGKYRDDKGHLPRYIKDGGREFQLYAENAYGEGMYWLWD